MTQSRGNALTGRDLRLDIGFLLDNVPTDVHEVRQVELLDLDGETVLQTIEAVDIEHIAGTGQYFATFAGEHLDAIGFYRDRWSFTWIAGEDEVSYTKSVYVSAWGADPTPGTVRIFSWEHAADGATPVAGVIIRAWPKAEGEYQASGGIGWKPVLVSTSTDAAGLWQLYLPPDKLFVVDVSATRHTLYEVTTPAAGAAQLETLLSGG